MHSGNTSRAVACTLAALAIGGCAQFAKVTDPEHEKQVTGIDKHSAYPVTRREYFERVNLIELVDPEGKAREKYKNVWKTEPGSDSANEWGARYDLVLAWFRESGKSDDEKKRSRNGIQERILSVSISRCNVFKTYLRRDQSDQNFLLGSLTTASGLLGAVMNGVQASRNLAAAAGLFSGIRSEYNQAYYSNLAAHVIVKGIEAKQELVYRRIQNEGQSKSIADYPLEAAIKDAVYFDGLCSVVVGLDQAAASISATSEPGLDAAMRTMLRARLAREALDMKSEDLLKPEKLEQLGLASTRLGLSLVGSVRGEATNKPDVDLFGASVLLASNADSAVNTVGKDIETAALVRLGEIIDALRKDHADQAKKLQDATPKEGAISTAVQAELKKSIVTPMKLDGCFMKLASAAAQARIDAAKKRDAAKTDAEKALAELEVQKAASAAKLAASALDLKEKLVRLDLETYKKARLDAIAASKAGDDLVDPAKVTGTATATATKDQSCT